jgi:hypothetical protein
VTKGQRRGATLLREAVDAYGTEQKGKLEQPELELLARLADSREAAEICERLELQEASFLTLCITTKHLARTFWEHVDREREMSAKLERLEKAVAVLRLFVADETKPPPSSDIFTPWMGFRGRDAVPAISRGLDLVAKLIEGRRGIASIAPSRRGETRDKHHREAPNNAAIWCLADAVRRATGKPHRREVVELVQVILGITVTENRVRHAVSAREKPRGLSSPGVP